MIRLAHILLSMVFTLTVAANAQELKTLKIGDKAPMHDVKMKNVDGRPVSIGDVNNQNGYIVIFSCNTCPFVVGGSSFAGWEKDYNEIVSKALSAGIGVIFVNSNEAKRNDGDSMEDMAQRFKEKGYTAPYVYDEKHQLADAFGAKTTPHIFFFNNNHELIFEGAIDNTWNPKVNKKEFYLLDAINAVANDKKIPNSTTPPKGCTIKRVAS